MTYTLPQNPSPEQMDILKTFKNTRVRHVFVNAAAGSGKSTTIRLCLCEIAFTDQYGRKKHALIISFNKPIAEANKEFVNNNEYLKQFSDQIKVSTIHGLGMALCHKRGYIHDYKGGEDHWDEYKYSKYVKNHVAELAGEDFMHNNRNSTIEHYAHNVIEGIKLCRIRCADKLEAVEGVLHEYEMDPIYNEPEAILKCIRWGIEHMETYDMNDLLYIPFNEGLQPTWRYDYIFVDEVQDISPVQLSLILKFLKRNGRIYAFGDDNQLINIWVGVEANSINAFKEGVKKVLGGQGDFTEFPLNGSYRCAPRIIEEALKVRPETGIVCARTDDFQGEVNHDVPISNIKGGDAILGRYKYQCMKIYIECIRNGLNCIINGNKNIENHPLIEMLDNATMKDVEMLNFDLHADGVFSRMYGRWRRHIENTMHDKKIDFKSALDTDEIINEYDNILTLEVLADGLTTKTELIDKINALNYNNAEDGESYHDDDKVLFSTIHKSKGCEYDTVYIIDESTLGAKNPRVNSESRKVEEVNLHYVAVTRAKNTLNYLAVDKSREGFKDRMNMKKMESNFIAVEASLQEIYPTLKPIDRRGTITKVLSGKTENL